jgi:ABC-type nitrate/sulfonate/bicarbonate transport system substrate-binding protein
LLHYGIHSDKIKLVEMPPGDMAHHLKIGTIDGFVVGEPEGSRALKLNYGWSPTLPSYLLDSQIDHVFLVSNTLIQVYPEKLQSLIDQLSRSGMVIENARDKPVEMTQLLQLAGIELYDSVFTSIPRSVKFDNIIASETDIVNMAQYLVDMALWPDASNALTLTYFDMRFAQISLHNLEGTKN